MRPNFTSSTSTTGDVGMKLFFHFLFLMRSFNLIEIITGDYSPAFFLVIAANWEGERIRTSLKCTHHCSEKRQLCHLLYFCNIEKGRSRCCSRASNMWWMRIARFGMCWYAMQCQSTSTLNRILRKSDRCHRKEIPGFYAFRIWMEFGIQCVRNVSWSQEVGNRNSLERNALRVCTSPLQYCQCEVVCGVNEMDLLLNRIHSNCLFLNQSETCNIHDGSLE